MFFVYLWLHGNREQWPKVARQQCAVVIRGLVINPQTISLGARVLRVRCFEEVGLVCSLIRTQGCRNTTRLFNPHERSNSTQDFTTSTRQACNYTWPLSLLYKHTASALISTHTVTSLLHFNKRDLLSILYKASKLYTRPLSHFNKPYWVTRLQSVFYKHSWKKKPPKHYSDSFIYFTA